MFVEVNGAKLYFDVEGSGLIPQGPSMKVKPTLVLLHGGPGFDHSMYKPAFSAVADLVQVIYFDQRGNGRSTGSDPGTWNLAQWGDDVKGLCDALGIERPIVYGSSFGGFVAQSYAIRHPEHPAKLVLASTAARMDFDQVFAAFERAGGDRARTIAEAYWLNPTVESRTKYLEVCLPLYHPRSGGSGSSPEAEAGSCSAAPDALQRTVVNHEVAVKFNGARNEQGRMDFRSDLRHIRCPVLVLAGGQDPITPMVFSETIAECLPSHLVRLERFPDCGHGVHIDDPDWAFWVLRDFILSW
jgi:proline iminopeptidase